MNVDDGHPGAVVREIRCRRLAGLVRFDQLDQLVHGRLEFLGLPSRISAVDVTICSERMIVRTLLPFLFSWFGLLLQFSSPISPTASGWVCTSGRNRPKHNPSRSCRPLRSLSRSFALSLGLWSQPRTGPYPHPWSICRLHLQIRTCHSPSNESFRPGTGSCPFPPRPSFLAGFYHKGLSVQKSLAC
jgi:hypothetical protein